MTKSEAVKTWRLASSPSSVGEDIIAHAHGARNMALGGGGHGDMASA